MAMDRSIIKRVGLLLSLTFFMTTSYAQLEQEWENNGERVQSSKLEIQAPDSLAGTLYHKGSLFGKYPFGETIVRNLYYTKRPLCNGQLPGTPDYIKSEGYILMVDRGDCSFVEKVRNAQRDNATAVIIADNTCLCSAAGSCEAEEECQGKEPTMDDDGTGIDIGIPSVLLLKPDADLLRDELVSGTIIQISLSFPIPKAVNGRTEYMLFTTPDDLMSHQFLNSFLEAGLGFGDKAYFKPRMFVKDGTEKGCRQYDDSHVPCAGYCINYGRYCEPRPFYDQEVYENKGTKMLVESMRRACIWDLYGKVDGVGRQWWTYVQLWMLHCSFSHYSASCAEELYTASAIDEVELETCMEDSGNFRQDVPNTMLETALEDAAQNNVTFAPVLLVNGAILPGAITFGNVVTAICSTFDESDRPDICSRWEACDAECTAGETCVLWGNDQECSEYRAPFLSNDDKQYDDDYIGSDSAAGVEVIGTNASEVNMTTSSPINEDSESFATTEPTMDETIDANALDQSEAPTQSLAESQPSPQAEELKTDAPTSPVGKTDPPQSGQPNPTETVLQPTSPPVFDKEGGGSGKGGEQDVIETIQIYEGSNNGLAIGLGVGFGAMFLFVILYLLIVRDRQQLQDYHTMVSLSGMSHGGGMSIGSRSHYSHFGVGDYPYGHRRNWRLPRHVAAEEMFVEELTQEEEEEDFFYDAGRYHPRRDRPSSRASRKKLMAKQPLSRFAKRLARRKLSKRDHGDLEQDGLMKSGDTETTDNPSTRRNLKYEMDQEGVEVSSSEDENRMSRKLPIDDDDDGADDEQSTEEIRLDDDHSSQMMDSTLGAPELRMNQRVYSSRLTRARGDTGRIDDDDVTVRMVNSESGHDGVSRRNSNGSRSNNLT